MSLFDAFRYDGKRALVVGGATGMGAAAAEVVRDAGAEVVVMDFADVTLDGVKAIHVNLAERASIEPRSARFTWIAFTPSSVTSAKSMTTTSAPASRTTSAAAAPIPVAPPTTSARLPS